MRGLKNIREFWLSIDHFQMLAEHVLSSLTEGTTTVYTAELLTWLQPPCSTLMQS